MEGTAKGIFFRILIEHLEANNHNQVLQLISEKLGKPLKYYDFFDYPVTEFVIMEEMITKHEFPEMTLEEVCFELGKISIELVAASAVGKVTIAYARKDSEAVIDNIEMYFEKFANMGQVKAKKISSRNYELIFTNWQNYPDYTHGLLGEFAHLINNQMRTALIEKKVDNFGQGKIKADFKLKIVW